MIIFTHIKTIALTKCFLIGLCFLSFKLLRHGSCQVCLRTGLHVLSSQVQQKSHLMRIVSQNYFCLFSETTLQWYSISKLTSNCCKTNDSLNSWLSKPKHRANFCYYINTPKKDQSILNLQLSQFLFCGNAYKNNGTWSTLQNWKSFKCLYF